MQHGSNTDQDTRNLRQFTRHLIRVYSVFHPWLSFLWLTVATWAGFPRIRHRPRHYLVTDATRIEHGSRHSKPEAIHSAFNPCLFRVPSVAKFLVAHGGDVGRISSYSASSTALFSHGCNTDRTRIKTLET